MAAVPARTAARARTKTVSTEAFGRAGGAGVARGARAAASVIVAAKAFASWTAYQGRGVATIVRGLEAAVALVRVEAARAMPRSDRARSIADLLLEAFRPADFILNHLAVGEDLGGRWGVVEG